MLSRPALRTLHFPSSSGPRGKGRAKKMFGGVVFMVRRHMTVGITNKSDLMARFEGPRHAEIAKWPGAKPMTFGKGDIGVLLH